MAVPRYYGIRSRKVEFRVRYFQPVLRSFADQPEVGCVPVVIRLWKGTVKIKNNREIYKTQIEVLIIKDYYLRKQ